MSFNGISEYIEVPHSEGLNITKPMSVVVHVRSHEDPGRIQNIVRKEQQWAIIITSNGKLLLEINEDLGIRWVWHYFSFNISVSEIAGSWHLLVATWDGSVVRLYIDGNLTAQYNI